MKILDCTLRDGGYYTGWDFPKNLVYNYLININKLPVEYIELGYIGKDSTEYKGEFNFLTVDKIKEVKNQISKKIAVMINLKEFRDVEEITNTLKKYKQVVDLFRFAVNPHEIDSSLAILSSVKNNLEIKIAVNLMYASEFYTNIELIENSLHKLNDFEIIYIVDSYGSIEPDLLEVFFKKLRAKVNIKLGFHGHNNLELALSNSIVAFKNGIQFIDATITGMGRGAGNLKLELLLTYLFSKKIVSFEYESLTSLVNEFEKLRKTHNWGTNFPYMFSGAYSIPQGEVMNLIQKKRYDLEEIIEIISSKNVKKLPIVNFYISKNVLIIGGGQSVIEHHEAIQRYIKLYKCDLIFTSIKHIELFNELNIKKYLAVAGKEDRKLTKKHTFDKLIYAPFSYRLLNNNKSFNEIGFELSEIKYFDRYPDSGLAIALEFAHSKNTKISLVGFDGYNNFKKRKYSVLHLENQNIFDVSSNYFKINSLTPTLYNNLSVKSIYSIF